MKALIDGDVVTYQCGFASDQKIYTCTDGAEFQYKKDAKAHQDTIIAPAGDITSRVEFEPVEHCLHSVKIFVNNVIKSIEADEARVFLTSEEGQTRKQIYPEYKAHRPSTKPHWYTEIRKYLIQVYNAEVITGLEADDAMAYHQMRDRGTEMGDMMEAETCICTVDKDLDMVPGFHFNWRLNGGKGEMYWVDHDQADRVFFEQWLVGDSADNIPGIPGVGPKTAKKMLDPIPDDPKLLYDEVLTLWQSKQPRPRDSKAFAHLVGDLLWMQRHPFERWDQYFGIPRE